MGDITRQPIGMKTKNDAELVKKTTHSRFPTSLKSIQRQKLPIFIPYPEGQRSKGPIQRRYEENLHLQQVKVRKLNKSYLKLLTNDKWILIQDMKFIF